MQCRFELTKTPLPMRARPVLVVCSRSGSPFPNTSPRGGSQHRAIPAIIVVDLRKDGLPVHRRRRHAGMTAGVATVASIVLAPDAGRGRHEKIGTFLPTR